jgi:prepilin signal peptidase PulO-like enzyme (type II secretory pathway)
VEQNCFIKKIHVNDLTLGDWLAEDVKLNHKLVMKKKTLEDDDLDKLKQLHLEHKLKEVLVKEGIPFIPSFLFAYLFLLFGKEIWLWLTKTIF